MMRGGRQQKQASHSMINLFGIFNNGAFCVEHVVWFPQSWQYPFVFATFVPSTLS